MILSESDREKVWRIMALTKKITFTHETPGSSEIWKCIEEDYLDQRIKDLIFIFQYCEKVDRMLHGPNYDNMIKEYYGPKM